MAQRPPPPDKDPARTVNEPPLATGIINPPFPTNIILETLRPVLAELQAAAARAPHDARVTSAVAHLSATIAALESPAAEPEAPTPRP